MIRLRRLSDQGRGRRRCVGTQQIGGSPPALIPAPGGRGEGVHLAAEGHQRGDPSGGPALVTGLPDDLRTRGEQGGRATPEHHRNQPITSVVEGRDDLLVGTSAGSRRQDRDHVGQVGNAFRGLHQLEVVCQQDSQAFGGRRIGTGYFDPADPPASAVRSRSGCVIVVLLASCVR